MAECHPYLSLYFKQFLTASNIDISDILESLSYFVLDLLQLKKDRTDASVYQQLFIEIRDRYRDHIPVYRDGSRDGNCVACATVFPSNTVISMRLPDSASVLTAEVCAIIKALEEIKTYVAPKYIVLQTHFRVSKLYNLLRWNILDTEVCPFKFCQKKILSFLGTQQYWH